MRLINYKPAKNNVLLEEVKVASSGSIVLHQEVSVGYYKVIDVGPLCQETSVGDFVLSALQMGTELTFVEGKRLQIPEHGIDGYYTPSNEELENPVPIFTSSSTDEEEELNVIDSSSDGGNNDLSQELGIRNQ